jgi:alpha,alpha-trehalase
MAGQADGDRTDHAVSGMQTTFTTAGGTAVLTDALALGRNDCGHDLGAGSPGLLLRRLVCIGGEIDAEVSYAPRPEYGLIRPSWSRSREG